MIKYQNKNLQKKYQNDPSFRQRAEAEEQRYRLLLAKSKQVLSQKSLEVSILQQYPYQENCQLYFWYGDLQPVPGKQTTKLTLLFLQTFKPKLDKQFIFVYFNNRTLSSDYFFEFKNIFLLLPLSILEKMKSFIVVKASKYIKVMSLVSSIGTLTAQSYLIYQNCKQLCQKLKLNVQDFVEFVPENICLEFPQSIKRRQSHLTSYRMNLNGQTRTAQQKKQLMQFQRAISAFIQKQIYSIQQFPLSQLGIPMILQSLIAYFQHYPQGLQLEGIFRKSVGVDQQDQILSQLKRADYQCLKNIKNPYMIASLIKKFFYNLKSPVIPYPHYNIMLADPTLNNIKAVVNTLPTVNYLSLLFLLQFLSKDVVKHQEKNKMNAYNLAVCFSQAIMRTQVASQSSITHAKTTVNITYEMLSNISFIFGENVGTLFNRHLVQKDKQFEKTIFQQLQIDVTSRISDKHAKHIEEQTVKEIVQQKIEALAAHEHNQQFIPHKNYSIPQNAHPPQKTTSYNPHLSLNLHQNQSFNCQDVGVDKKQTHINKQPTSPLAQRILDINSQLKFIEDRFKNRKQSFAAQQAQFKSFIFEGDQEIKQFQDETQPSEWKRSNTFGCQPQPGLRKES